jgi:AGCS family alanine or glycine:cation symporter
MNTFESIVSTVNGIVWGPFMLAAILGTGLWLSFGLRGMPVLGIPRGFRLLLAGRQSSRPGDISPFQALMTSLAATVGTGNIAGVATAVALGGPGAIFWMWCTALVGMATKYAEAVLAVEFRRRDEDGGFSGGPMYYIRHGLGENWAWLGFLFALFGAAAGFGIGNTVQSNSVAHALETSFAIPTWATGAALFVLAGAVVLGGVRRIARVAEMLVPFMALAYLGAGAYVLVTHAADVPAALVTIVRAAFSGEAAVGGFAGAGVWAALRFGVARGVFSNEAGLGSAPIAHAAARTDSPVEQGMIAMLGTFIDTLLLCTVTGLVIVLSGAWQSGATGAELSSTAFAATVPGGDYVVSLGLAVFAFTTILGWSYYSERCVVYLFGVRAIQPFRILWVLAVPVGALAELDFVWLLADTLNALMALPNLVALLLLSPLVFRLTREARDRQAP